MNDINQILFDKFKKSLKHYVEELRDRDDYEVKISESRCYICGEKAKIPQFRIPKQKEWKSVYRKEKVECKACADYNAAFKVIEKNRLVAHDSLINYLEKEYWLIPYDLKNSGFKNFKVTSSNVFMVKKEAMDYVKRFVEVDSTERGNLLIMGNPGTGKTHLATAIARTIKEKGFLVGQLTTGSLLSKIKSTYHNEAIRTEENILDDLERFDLLILDDLGSEAGNKDTFGWSKKMLLEIVNRRIGKATIYTSNFNEEHLPTAIGERAFSRLNYHTKFLELVTDDYRKNFQVK